MMNIIKSWFLCLTLFQGFTIFAGFSDKQNGAKLKEESSARLHVIQLDVTSEKDIKEAFIYIHKNLPANAPGEYFEMNLLGCKQIQ